VQLPDQASRRRRAVHGRLACALPGLQPCGQGGAPGRSRVRMTASHPPPPHLGCLLLLGHPPLLLALCVLGDALHIPEGVAGCGAAARQLGSCQRLQPGPRCISGTDDAAAPCSPCPQRICTASVAHCCTVAVALVFQAEGLVFCNLQRGRSAGGMLHGGDPGEIARCQPSLTSCLLPRCSARLCAGQATVELCGWVSSPPTRPI